MTKYLTSIPPLVKVAMQMQKQDSGVSPVIGIILMVAVTSRIHHSLRPWK